MEFALRACASAVRRSVVRGSVARGSALRRAAVRRPATVRRPRAAAGGDRGLSTIEVVILAPVIIMFVLMLVAFGQLVDGRGAVDGAARDAARAGSIEHSRSEAIQQAVNAAHDDLAGTCTEPATVTPVGDTSFRPDTLFTIEVTCTVRGLSFLGLPITKTVTSTSASPLDPYRRSAT